MLQHTSVAASAKLPYPYVLEAEHHVLSGRIFHDALPGVRVPMETETRPEDTPQDASAEGSGGFLRITYHKVTEVPTTHKLSTLHTSPDTTVTEDPNVQVTTSTETTGTHTQGETAKLTSEKDSEPATTRQSFVPTRNTITNPGSPALTDEQSDYVQDEIADTAIVKIFPQNVQPAPHIHSKIHLIHSSHLHHKVVDHRVHKRNAVEHFNINAYPVNIDKTVGIDSYSNRDNGGVDIGVHNPDFDPEKAFRNELDLINDAENRIGVFIRQKRNVQEAEAQAVRSDPLAEHFVVKETTAFTVDKEGYIIVDDSEILAEHSLIDFFVCLVNDDGVILSNPVAFIVHVERPGGGSGYPAVPAVFAGVLVLIVVLLAFIIPLVTRAKRRHKQGKPLFKLGSHPSTVDLRGAESQASLRYNKSEPDWYGNNAYSYEEEVEQGKRDFTRGLRQISNPPGSPTTEPPTLQLNKKQHLNETLSDRSSSSGIGSTEQLGADGYSAAEESFNQRF
ncbi:uncharacterized protein LOC128245678 isoform X2 [Mya arenaria]|uniref:uncharacterized protein LOC128245678 isoform X2 n=1 Tax=Mya arenaria TaxID=6604 RepID=UPI0022E6FA05|nr:uncharacterized protein LOC128245678 isoform X2 [Mya arenaria]